MINYRGWRPIPPDELFTPYSPDPLRLKIFKGLIDCLATLIKSNQTSKQENEKPNNKISLYQIFLNILIFANIIDSSRIVNLPLIVFPDTTPVLDMIKTINSVRFQTTQEGLPDIIDTAFYGYISTCESFTMWGIEPWRICPHLGLLINKDTLQPSFLCTPIDTPCPRALVATNQELYSIAVKIRRNDNVENKNGR